MIILLKDFFMKIYHILSNLDWILMPLVVIDEWGMFHKLKWIALSLLLPSQTQSQWVL